MLKESSEKLNYFVKLLQFVLFLTFFWIGFFDHENVISLVDVIKPESKTGYNDIYIVTDLMETDLHRVIYSKQVKRTSSMSFS